MSPFSLPLCSPRDISCLGIGCAGELQLTPHDDYEKWAITILVKFRDTEQLQQLTAHRQSGGVCRSLAASKRGTIANEYHAGAFLDDDLIPHEHDRVRTRTILVG